jgi:uncharacterized membrane protein
MSCFELKNRDVKAAYTIVTKMFTHRRMPDASIILRLLNHRMVWDATWTECLTMTNSLYQAAKLQGWVHMRRELIAYVVALYGHNVLIRRMDKSFEVDSESRRHLQRMVRFDEPSRRYVMDESMTTEAGVIKYWRMVNELPGYEKFDGKIWTEGKDRRISRREGYLVRPSIHDSVGRNYDLETLLGMVGGNDMGIDADRDFLNYTRAHPSPAYTTGRFGMYVNDHTVLVWLLLTHCDYNGFQEARRIILRDYQVYRDWDVVYESRLKEKLFA